VGTARWSRDFQWATDAPELTRNQKNVNGYALGQFMRAQRSHEEQRGPSPRMILWPLWQGGRVMFKEADVWTPDQELQLLEELAEAEAEAFDMEMELSFRVAAAESERPWVAYWQLPQNGNGVGLNARAQNRLTRGR
jgi:hypothetical protein